MTSMLELPTFATGDPITPSGRAKEPNPYDDYLPKLGLNSGGYSASQTATLPDKETARKHEAAIRRAAKGLHLSVSVIARPNEIGSWDMTFGIVPTRVRNTRTDTVETPAVDTEPTKAK